MCYRHCRHRSNYMVLESEIMKAKIVRQTAFRDDGSITDLPARNEEQPQMEQQESLFTYQETEQKLRQWKGDKDNDK